MKKIQVSLHHGIYLGLYKRGSNTVQHPQKITKTLGNPGFLI